MGAGSDSVGCLAQLVSGDMDAKLEACRYYRKLRVGFIALLVSKK